MSGSEREQPWVEGARNAAGFMLDTLFTKKGKLINYPGVGSCTDSIGSIYIKRNRIPVPTHGTGRGVYADEWGVMDACGGLARTEAVDAEWGHEIFLPRRTLSGALPDVLLENYSFWKTGPLTLRGYAQGSKAAADTILVRLRLGKDGGTAGGVDSYGGVVRRLLCRAEGEGGQEASTGAKTSGSMLLLNPLRAKEGTALYKMGQLLARLDSLSHIRATAPASYHV